MVVAEVSARAGDRLSQAFFSMSKSVVSDLVGKRQLGYEVGWLEKGDLDYADFWTYSR